MQDTTVNGLRASIRALEDVITPAVDATNPLAVEQLRMVRGYLALVADRLALRHDRLRRQATGLLALGRAVLPHAATCGEAMAKTLQGAVDRVASATAAIDTPEDELTRSGTALAATLSALVRECAVHEPQTRDAVERAVVQASGAWIDVERAWFAPLGFDAEAKSLPPLDRLLQPTDAKDIR
jgi:hypothetical protein